MSHAVLHQCRCVVVKLETAQLVETATAISASSTNQWHVIGVRFAPLPTTTQGLSIPVTISLHRYFYCSAEQTTHELSHSALPNYALDHVSATGTQLLLPDPRARQ